MLKLCSPLSIQHSIQQSRRDNNFAHLNFSSRNSTIKKVQFCALNVSVHQHYERSSHSTCETHSCHYARSWSCSSSDQNPPDKNINRLWGYLKTMKETTFSSHTSGIRTVSFLYPVCRRDSFIFPKLLFAVLKCSFWLCRTVLAISIAFTAFCSSYHIS